MNLILFIRILFVRVIYKDGKNYSYRRTSGFYGEFFCLISFKERTQNEKNEKKYDINVTVEKKTWFA